jgi:hypothetical protein
MSDPETPSAPILDIVPFRKVTSMAVDSLLGNLQRALAELAAAAVADGEAPAGYIFDVDKRVWRRPS